MSRTTQQERDELRDDPHPQPEDVRGVIDDLQRAEELLRQTNAELKEVLNEDGGCDHDAGICYCRWVWITEDNDDFLGEQP